MCVDQPSPPTCFHIYVKLLPSFSEWSNRVILFEQNFFRLFFYPSTPFLPSFLSEKYWKINHRERYTNAWKKNWKSWKEMEKWCRWNDQRTIKVRAGFSFENYLSMEEVNGEWIRRPEEEHQTRDDGKKSKKIEMLGKCSKAFKSTLFCFHIEIDFIFMGNVSLQYTCRY